MNAVEGPAASVTRSESGYLFQLTMDRTSLSDPSLLSCVVPRTLPRVLEGKQLSRPTLRPGNIRNFLNSAGFPFEIQNFKPLVLVHTRLSYRLQLGLTLGLPPCDCCHFVGNSPVIGRPIIDTCTLNSFTELLPQPKPNGVWWLTIERIFCAILFSFLAGLRKRWKGKRTPFRAIQGHSFKRRRG